LKKIEILDVPFVNLDELELLNYLDEAVATGNKTQVCFVPTNSILSARSNPRVMKVYRESNLVVCDGVPVLFASKFLGTPLKQRLSGFDIFPLFISHSALKGYRIFLMGANTGVAESLANKYSLVHKGLNIAGTYCPSFNSVFSEEENNHMINLINESRADVLFVSLTAPKQDLWIYEHFDSLNVKIAMGVGAAFDAENGSIKRAPQWIQRLGFEWFFRFLQEPKRLFKRYFLDAPVFILLILRLKLKKTFF
jgi:N-acetylglucosaminyldiphosphoundecaprenol N-acetyl-beta-D-mannosaminyltransferase